MERLVINLVPKRLNPPSFIDYLDTPIGNFDPENQVAEGRLTPPPGILNAPYGMDRVPDTPDDHNPSYDTDWSERLSNPVPGAGVYIGEFIDRCATPKIRNVV